MPQHLPSAKEIFLGAVDRTDPADRDRYLSEACSTNAELRRHVEALLRLHDQPDTLFDQERIEAGAIMQRADISDATMDQIPQECPGTQIGPYKLLQQIGEGGMGVVWMAEQHAPVRRKVALKVIKPGMDTRQVIARFEAERQALSLMDHPNIAKVLDAGATANGRPYFVMELVKGQPITQYCDERHLTPRQRLELLLPVCQAIHHAHQKGIIHRDIKPTNVLVAEYDQRPVPKVIDFGVAKATSQTLTEKTMFTGYGQIVGTLEYMSPEQAKVNQLDIDTRSDIYSLGVLHYELLTGSTPFDRTRLRTAAFDEILRIIREEEPPKPSTRLAESGDSLPSISAQRQTEPAKLTRLLQGELDWIVMKALEKNRGRRYESAIGLALDVQRYLNDEPVQACPPSTRYRLAKFVRRHRGAVIAAALLMTILLAGIAGTTIGLIRAEKSRRDADTARENERLQRQAAEKLADSEHDAKELATLAKSAAEESEQEARKKSTELEKKLYVNLVGRAHSDWLGGSVKDSLRRLQECPPQLRRWEWNFVQRLCHLDRWTDAGNGRCAWSVAISPDGSQMACGTGQYLWSTEPGAGGVVVRDAADGRLIFTKDGLRGGVHGVAFSPDGRQLACCTGFWGTEQEGELIVWDVATQERRWSRKVPSAELLCVAFSPDSSKIAVGSGHYNSRGSKIPSTASIHDAVTGEPLRMFPSRSGSVHAVAFSPDGQRLALGESEEVELFNVKDGALVRRFEGHASFVYAVAFSRDGTRMATGEYASPVRIWDVESGNVVTHIQGDQSRGLAFDGDGGRLAIATGVAKAVRICDSTTGATLAMLRGHLAETMCVAFHPDDTGLISGSRDGAVKMWNAKPQPIVLNHKLRKTEHPWITSVAAEPKGRRVITASRDNTVQVWDAERGDLLRTWEGPSDLDSNWMDTFWSVAISPDGRQVFAGHGRGTILRWDTETGESLPPLKSQGGLVMALAISADGRWLASSGFNHLIHVWSLPKGELAHTITTGLDGRGVNCLEFSPDSTKLAAGSGHLSFLDSPGGLALWDVASEKQLWSTPATLVSVRDVTFSPEGTTVAAALNDGRILVHETQKGRELAAFAAHAGNAYAAAFTPDSRRLITGGVDGIKIWDSEDWSEVFVYVDQAVLCLALGDCGQKLVFGGFYPSASVLDSTFPTQVPTR